MQFPLKFFTGTNIIGFYKEKVARMIGYFILFMPRRIVQGKMNTGNYTLGYFHFLFLWNIRIQMHSMRIFFHDKWRMKQERCTGFFACTALQGGSRPKVNLQHIQLGQKNYKKVLEKIQISSIALSTTSAITIEKNHYYIIFLFLCYLINNKKM